MERPVPVRRFLEAIREIREDFKAIELRVVAFRWNSQWVNLSTRAVLSTRRAHEFKLEPAPPDLPDLKIDGASLPMKHFDNLLGVFETGEFGWGETSINVTRIPNAEFGAPYSPSFSTYERNRSRDWLGIDTLCFEISGGDTAINGSLGREGFEILDSKIASLETPFDGIADLVKTYTGYDRMQDSSSYSRFELVAPLWIRFEPGCLLGSGVAVARAFLRGGHEVDKASVGFIQMDGSEVLRRDREPFRVVGEMEEAQHLFVETETSLSPQANRVILLLSYGDIRVDRLELYRNRVSGHNPRMGAFASVDPDLSTFREGLRGQGKKPGVDFEHAFLTLLTFLGFSSVHTGYSERNADLLAWADDPSIVFVVECTTGEPDLRGKATKFVARLRHIDSVAPDSRPVGIMATTLSRASINPADLERLKTDRIILVDSEGLDELADLADRGGSIGEALELLRNFAGRQHMPSGEVF